MAQRKFLYLVIVAGTALPISVPAQSNNVIVGAGYTSPAPIVVAPGQIVTIVVQGIGANLTQTVQADRLPLPTTLAGISVNMQQTLPAPFPKSAAVPLLEVSPLITCFQTDQLPPCGRALTAVTLQIPYEMPPHFPFFEPAENVGALVVSEGGVAGDAFELLPRSDRIHIITTCAYVNPDDVAYPFSARCGPVVTHGNGGALVTAANPAKGGEVLVMYAFGFGATIPAVKSGEASPFPAPTLAPFPPNGAPPPKPLIGFDFRKNAAPQRVEEVGPDQSALLFAGLTPGFVGLYQINFRVPALPNGLPRCDVPSGPPQLLNVRSNLTVNISAPFSFDGAPICVDPGN